MVTEGTLEPSGTFKADTVLAKHDENYMPKEVADALKKQGHWKRRRAANGLAGEPKGSTRDRRDSAITRWCWRWRLPLIQAMRAALSARARTTPTLMGVAAPDRAGAVRLRRDSRSPR